MVASLLALTLHLGCPASAPPAPRGPATLLPIAPDLRSVSASELEQLVSAPADRPRVVNLWATWCPPCVAEIPAFEGWAAEHPEVDLILLSVDHPSAEPKVRAWLARHELPHLRSGLVADEASLARSVPGWNEMLPYTVVIAPSGEVTRKFTGAVSLEQLSIASREASGAVASGSGSD